MADKNVSNSEEPQEKLGLFSVFKSVAAAMIGVQSDKNRRRDFQQKSIWPFIIVGIVFVVVFVLTLVAVVSMVVE